MIGSLSGHPLGQAPGLRASGDPAAAGLVRNALQAQQVSGASSAQSASVRASLLIHKPALKHQQQPHFVPSEHEHTPKMLVSPAGQASLN